MKITPLFDRVVIKTLDASEKTSGGIILPATAQEKPQLATVIAIGDGTNFEGKSTEMKVKVGDKILYSKFAGIEYALDGESFVIIRQSDILGKVL